MIDSGLCRQIMFDTRTGLSHLETTRISIDMATQRMGRAGRVAEGTCYRLWTKASEHLMAEQRTAEIEYADLAPMALDIAMFGEKNIDSLPWLTQPPRANISSAKDLLVSLGAIDTDNNITPLGKRIAALPCHPRMARMIVCADTAERKALACDIAALLEEKDPLADNADTDMTLRLSLLRLARRKKQIGRWQRIAKIAAEYRNMAHTT